MQIHGAHGCSDDYPVARFYRDAKVMEIIEGSTELQQLTIAADAYRKRPVVSTTADVMQRPALRGR